MVKKYAIWLISLMGTGIVFFCFLFWYGSSDRHSDYEIDLQIPGDKSGSLKVGFAKKKVIPENFDPFHDSNSDARYYSKHGDTFIDMNQNGKQDPLWLAGFHHNRPATKIHDPLWARAMVIDNGISSIALVSIDAIGIFYDDVIDIRKMVPAEKKPDHIIIMATHTHSAPDLIGIWGASEYESGIDFNYLAHLKQQAVEAIIQAMDSRAPAKLRLARDHIGAENLQVDTRKPIIKDQSIRIMHAVSTESGETLGTLVSWANHPEVLWDHNLEISSDFPHYLREAIEKGIPSNIPEESITGLGGITIFANGAVGGLMTTPPDLAIPSSNGPIMKPSFEKAKAVGQNVAKLALEAIRSDHVYTINEAKIKIVAKTIQLPLDNQFFRLGITFGVINRGLSGYQRRIKTEINAFSIGLAEFITIPGEIYPEIVNAGISAPVGQDFRISPQEIPPLRLQMQGEFKFVLGLANDFIGYIIPESEWDAQPPWLYNSDAETYGEVNSLGGHTAKYIFTNTQQLLQRLHSKN